MTRRDVAWSQVLTSKHRSLTSQEKEWVDSRILGPLPDHGNDRDALVTCNPNTAYTN